MKQVIFSLIIAIGFASCQNKQQETQLPYYGQHDVELIEKDGEIVSDTTYHTVPKFYLIDQDSNQFDNSKVEGKIHVVNFFFTSCPAICPAMIAQMKRLQGMTNDIEELEFLSHTIDPKRDTLAKLRAYIKKRNLDTHNWHFLYGDKAYVHELGQDGYMLNAKEDKAAEGGFLHSEHFVLVDRSGHIRGLYVGTDVEQVNQLNKDIRKLISQEYE